jgi:hypothetical protein
MQGFEFSPKRLRSKVSARRQTWHSEFPALDMRNGRINAAGLL